MPTEQFNRRLHMSFSNLKKSSKNGVAALSEKMNSEKKGANFESDDRYWAPELDKAGNGFAIIRFLPAPDGEDAPYVKLYSHGFKVGSRWYIENCPTTIGGECPACAGNSELWNTGISSNQDIVRQRKRRLHYISNILVVSDNKNPDNEGRVFLFKYGFKIFEKIMASIQPEFEDETPLNPFDFWEGANFKLKIRQVEGYRNYGRAELESQSALFEGDDAALEELWKKEYKLRDLVAPTEFKALSVLKEKYDSVICSGSTDSLENAIRKNNEADIDFETAPPKSIQKPKSTPTSSIANADENDDDDLSLYAKLLADD